MIHKRYEAEIMACEDEACWKTVLERIAKQFGFEYYIYGYIIQVQGGEDIPRIFSNYPEKWLERYQANEYLDKDPIAKHIARYRLPFTWDEAPYITPEEKRIMREAASFKLVNGLTIPLHATGLSAGLSFVTSDLDYTNYDEHSANLMYIANALHHSVVTDFQKTAESFTEQQKQVMLLLNKKQSTKLIADEMGLSESGVKHHINTIYDQMRLQNHHRNRQQMLSIARMLGLLPVL